MDATRTKTVLLESYGTIRCALSNAIKNEYIFLFAGYILACLACYLYVVLTGNGLRAIYGDSWVYTDLAKRIALNHFLLHWDYVRFFYPPLYPALISIAYLFREQAAIFETIKIINILTYSSAFIPMFCLLKHYAGLSRSQSFVGAILLLINWCPLYYVIQIASEPLYCPLLAWFAWFLVDNKYLKNKFDLLLFIFIFIAIPLTRTIGNLVFPCFAGATIIKLINMRNNHSISDSRKLIGRSIIVLIASALIMLLYMYLKSMLPRSPGDFEGGYFFYLLEPQTIPIYLKPSYWFDRTAFAFSWILIGTGTVAVPLILSIVIRNTKILFKDILASFLFLFLAGTFVLVALFTAMTPIPGNAFERYYNPFLFLFIVILLKYFRLFARKDIIIAGAITLIGVIAAPPLTTHASCFALSQTHLWAVYVLLYGIGGAMFISMLFILYRHKQYFVNLFLIMMTMSIAVLYFLDYLGGNKFGPNIFSFYDAHGITRQVLAERSSNPKTELIVDISWRDSRGDCKYWEYWKIMINLPMIPVFEDLTSYLSDPQNKGKRFMLLTHQNIPNAVKIVKGRDISLYIFDH